MKRQMGRYKMGLCFSDKFRMNRGAPPLDVVTAFVQYTEGGNHMTAEQLCRFLVEVQDETEVLVSDAEKIIERITCERHHITKFLRHTLNLDDFFSFLFSDDLNHAIDSKVHQDMDSPLSHYFIYTSHNSYLTGNQINSECSDVPLIKALKRGVRALEPDLWPNSTKDDTLVLHGWAWTSPVELIKCLRSIKEHAFSASSYPVIITLEDHLTPDLQAKAAEGYGRAIWMMHGMFRGNGGCGYVKKSDFMMRDGPGGEVFDPKAKLPIKTTLKVKVYMGKGWDSGF